MANVVLDAFVRFLADTKAIDKATAPGGAIDKATTSAGKRTGSTLGSLVGNGVSKAFTAAGAAGGLLFTSAVQGATTFEDQLRTINTVAGLTDDELFKVGDQIQEVSRQTGKSTDDLASGFYDLVSAGVPAEKAIAVLTDSAKFATGALGSTAEAVDLVTSVMNAYGLEADSSAQITDVFAKAVADGKVTAAQLGQSIARIAPVAAQAGVSMQEVSAGYAVLTAKGVPAAEAATQMTAAISALLTPNETLNEIQKQTGINFAELAKAKGLAVALDTLRQSTHGNNEEFAKAVGSMDALKFALATTGENAQGFSQEIIKVTEAQGLAEDQYAEKSKSAAEQGKRLSAQINTFLQDLGGPFVQAFGPATMAVGTLGQALIGLSSVGKIAGTVLGGIGGRLAGALTNRLTKVGAKAAESMAEGIEDSPSLKKALGNALTNSLGKITSTPAFGAGADKLGSFMGSKLGKGLSIAFAAVAVAEVINTYNEIKSGLAEQTAQINTEIGEATRKQTDAELAQTKAVIEQGLQDINGVWDAGLFTTDTRKGLEANLAEVTAEMQRRATAMGPALGSSLASGAPAVEAGATAMVEGLPDATQAASDQATYIVAKTPQEIADAIYSRRDAAEAGWSSLLDGLKNAMSPAKERARLIGYVTSDELRKALASKDPALRAQAAATRDVWLAQLGKLPADGDKLGGKAGEALRKALHSKNPAIRHAAEQARDAMKNGIQPAVGQASNIGANAGNAFSNAFKNNATIPTIFLSGSFARGKSNDRGKAAGGPVSANQPYVVGEKGWELFVPKVDGEIMTHADSVKAMSDGPLSSGTGSSGQGDTHYNMPLTVQGALPVRTLGDIVTEQRRISDLGKLPPRNLSPAYPRREAATG